MIERKGLKINVLCYLDHYSGRDAEIIMPIIYFIERYLNCSIEYAHLYDIYAICRKKPDIVLTTNTIGSPFHRKIAKYAYDQNIKVFALFSEGNFKTDKSINYWGYNHYKKFFQEYVCCWSKRTADFLIDNHPKDKNKIVVTGASGFDRYSIFKFLPKKEFLCKYNKQDYKHVISYFGWSFGRLEHKRMRTSLLRSYHNDLSRLDFLAKERDLIEGILKTAIINHPEILFVLKRHPQEIYGADLKEPRNEINRLKDFENVLYLNQNEDIYEIINASDLILGYESTTAMESWILNKSKPTIFITPHDPLHRSKIYTGCLIARSYEKLRENLDEFYSTDSISAFNETELNENRRSVLSRSIGYDDGLNHIRTSFYFKKVCDSIDNDYKENKRRIFNFEYFIQYIALKIGKLVYNRNLFSRLPKFKKTVWVFEGSKFENFFMLKEKYKPFFDEFYKENNIDKKYRENTLFKELICKD